MPARPAGTIKLALKLPLASVVTVAGVVVTALLLYLMVIVLLAPKPVPLTVTLVPETPLVGEMVIFCATVKVAVAELALASWAFMVWLPREVGGIAKVLLGKVPLLLVEVVVPMLTSSK